MTNTASPKYSWFEQVKRQIESMPAPKTEESIVFRILVQALVIVGIIATDVAAQTDWSLWAVPLSIIGGVFSWYRRSYRNITLKFLLAIAMLGVLFLFLSNLVENLNDSRTTLAGLLVQLQVVHSFDLPRRKDLGYSMIIGLILLGVAGTVSQTMAFAPWLFLFLAIALPTLVLDYRSRLGLEKIDQGIPWFSRKKKQEEGKISQKIDYGNLYPKRLMIILGITLSLGMVFFAVMPRFPSYQLQSFPVGGPTDIQDRQFDNKNKDLINPGYVKEGKEGKEGKTGEGGGGNSPTSGAGLMDDTFYYGFNSKMNQNLRGGMKSQVVLRIRSQAPGFWQALSFDRYTGQGWEISGDQNIETVRRSPWSYRFDLFPNSGFGESKRIIQTYTAVKELPNVIPNLAVPRSIYFPTKEIGLDQNNSLRSPVGLVEGLTYTVVSQVPYRDRTLLGQASQQYSKSIQKRFLQIPPEINDRVRQKAIELLSKSPKPINSVYETALFLAQSLKQNYTVRTDLPYFDKDDDLVEAFLFKYQGGYPDHFSTVLTVMLRSMGIASRLTAGFSPGQFNPFTGYYLVRNTDAYVLTEVYFPRYGWFAFDPIPGHDLFPTTFEDEGNFGLLKRIWDWVAGWLPSPITNFFSLFFTNVIGAFFGFLGWLWRLVSGSLLGALLGLIGAIAAGFLGWIGWQQLKNWLYRRRLAKLPPMSRLYQQLLKLLKNQGYPKNFAQTPMEYLDSLREKLPTERLEIIEEISLAYVSWRYGEQPPNIEYLQKQLNALIRSMEREKSLHFLMKSR